MQEEMTMQEQTPEREPEYVPRNAANRRSENKPFVLLFAEEHPGTIADFEKRAGTGQERTVKFWWRR